MQEFFHCLSAEAMDVTLAVLLPVPAFIQRQLHFTAGVASGMLFSRINGLCKLSFFYRRE